MNGFLLFMLGLCLGFALAGLLTGSKRRPGASIRLDKDDFIHTYDD